MGDGSPFLEHTFLAALEEAGCVGGDTGWHPAPVTVWDGGRLVGAAPAYVKEHSYCEYVYERYGRFPANSGPFRTVLAHQVHHLDPDFYERFYRPETLTEPQRHHRHAAYQSDEGA